MQPIALSIYTQHKGKSHSNDNHVLAKLLWRPCKRRGDARRYFSWRRWPYNSLQGILRASERVLYTCVKSYLYICMRNTPLHTAHLYALRLCFSVGRLPPYSRERGGQRTLLRQMPNGQTPAIYHTGMPLTVEPIETPASGPDVRSHAHTHRQTSFPFGDGYVLVYANGRKYP